jgi:hypothetical protein
VASQKVVYMHGTGTVVSTDIYETFDAATGATPLVYTYGILLYASQNGLLTKETGGVNGTVPVGIVLKSPVPGTDPYMTVQMRI